MKVFYMVFVQGGNNPACVHDSIEGARNEAARLARLTGVQAFVLKAVQCIEISDVKITYLEDYVDNPHF
jgi:hypothetical protein